MSPLPIGPSRRQPHGRPLKKLVIAAAIVVPLGIVVLAASAALMLAGGPLLVIGERFCSGPVQVERNYYSYKPGQHGVDYRVICLEGGARRDITDRTVSVMLLGGGALLAVPIGLAVIVGLVRARNRRSPRANR